MILTPLVLGAIAGLLAAVDGGWFSFLAVCIGELAMYLLMRNYEKVS